MFVHVCIHNALKKNWNTTSFGAKKQTKLIVKMQYLSQKLQIIIS